MSKQIHVGSVPVGGGADIAIQSMCNTRTEDVAATVAQILRLEEAGCDIIRVAVPDMTAAQAVGRIRRAIHIPLVADIHFDYKLALAARASPSASVSTAAHWSGNCCKNTAASPRRRWWRVPWAMSAC